MDTVRASSAPSQADKATRNICHAGHDSHSRVGPEFDHRSRHSSAGGRDSRSGAPSTVISAFPGNSRLIKPVIRCVGAVAQETTPSVVAMWADNSLTPLRRRDPQASRTWTTHAMRTPSLHLLHAHGLLTPHMLPALASPRSSAASAQH